MVNKNSYKTTVNSDRSPTDYSLTRREFIEVSAKVAVAGAVILTVAEPPAMAQETAEAKLTGEAIVVGDDETESKYVRFHLKNTSIDDLVGEKVSLQSHYKSCDVWASKRQRI